MGPYYGKVASASDGPWIVTHIGQGGVVDDWWRSAPGKIAAPPTLRWESRRGGGAAIFPVNTVHFTVEHRQVDWRNPELKFLNVQCLARVTARAFNNGKHKDS